MKTITKLKGTAAETTDTPSVNVLTALHDEPTPGFFRQLTLCPTLLVASRRGEIVAIPVGEIWALLEAHCPALCPAAAKTAPRSLSVAAKARQIGAPEQPRKK